MADQEFDQLRPVRNSSDPNEDHRDPIIVSGDLISVNRGRVCAASKTFKRKLTVDPVFAASC
jgi:hypothetical protein